jgi:hypothetical protein
MEHSQWKFLSKTLEEVLHSKRVCQERGSNENPKKKEISRMKMDGESKLPTVQDCWRITSLVWSKSEDSRKYFFRKRTLMV